LIIKKGFLYIILWITFIFDTEPIILFPISGFLLKILFTKEEEKMENLRRIITGHNDDGRSVISIDGPPARILGEDVGGLFEIWNTDGEQINSLDVEDRADINVILSPPKNGTKFRYFAIKPTPEDISREKLEEATARAFELMGAAHERVDTSRHPAMHKTKTIDYIILLKGDVTLLLDEDEVRLKPFNVVVQRGTNHAWVNNGNEPALLIAVLIDSDLKDKA